mmetsp:Transcript_17584/g.39760  ORF Transcript_17584/g.39760 Transcript_17584/m.39760 type:complete len:225 (+) Transcript_17584:2143-2817(+)
MNIFKISTKYKYFERNAPPSMNKLQILCRNSWKYNSNTIYSIIEEHVESSSSTNSKQIVRTRLDAFRGSIRNTTRSFWRGARTYMTLALKIPTYGDPRFAILSTVWTNIHPISCCIAEATVCAGQCTDRCGAPPSSFPFRSSFASSFASPFSSSFSSVTATGGRGRTVRPSQSASRTNTGPAGHVSTMQGAASSPPPPMRSRRTVSVISATGREGDRHRRPPVA